MRSIYFQNNSQIVSQRKVVDVLKNITSII